VRDAGGRLDYRPGRGDSTRSPEREDIGEKVGIGRATRRSCRLTRGRPGRSGLSRTRRGGGAARAPASREVRQVRADSGGGTRPGRCRGQRARVASRSLSWPFFLDRRSSRTFKGACGPRRPRHVAALPIGRGRLQRPAGDGGVACLALAPAGNDREREASASATGIPAWSSFARHDRTSKVVRSGGAEPPRTMRGLWLCVPPQDGFAFSTFPGEHSGGKLDRTKKAVEEAGKIAEERREAEYGPWTQTEGGRLKKYEEQETRTRSA